MVKKTTKRVLRKISEILGLLGYYPSQTVNFFRGLPLYYRDLKELKRQKGDKTDFEFGTPFPILGERFTESGTMSGHYFHQDLLIARRIYENKPTRHVDIGSRLDGFVAHVAVFREIEVFDIRAQTSKVKNITFRQADLMNLPAGMIDYCDSLSSLHVIEHFGLGRYGDTVDYYGYRKAIDTIEKILKLGGTFYFSVPMGRQRIEFNAHRVFATSTLLQLFEGRFAIKHFSYVNDAGDLFENVELDEKNVAKSFDCEYGCGIFEMTKL